MSQGVDVGGFLGSNFDGDKAIHKIIQSKKERKIPIENYQFLYQMKKKAWEGLQKTLSNLNSASRNLYSPLYSPFKKTVTSSSDKNLIDALQNKVDSKKIKPGQYSVIPKQKANKTHFRSDSINPSDKLNATQFNITYKNKDYSVNFTGGSVQDLADSINKSTGEFLTAHVIHISNDQVVLDLEGKKIGSEFAFDIQSPSSTLKKIGLLKNASPEYNDIHITSKDNLSSNKDISEILQNNKITLHPNDFANKVILPAKSLKPKAQAWIYIENNPSKKNKQMKKNNKSNKPSPKPSSLGFIDKMWVGDSDLYGDGLFSSFNKSSSLEKSKHKDQNNNPPKSNSNPYKLEFTAKFGNTPFSLQKNFNGLKENLQIIKIPLREGTLNSIKIKNLSSNNINIVKVEIVNLNVGKLAPKNSISKAQNAVVNYKGIDYERTTNDIKDIIPGVKLHINASSQKPVKINLNWDYDSVFSKIKDWVVAYNNMIDYIKNVTVRDRTAIKMGRSLMDEIAKQKKAYEKMSSDEKKTLSQSGELFKGMLASEFTVGTVKRKLQDIIIHPYNTDAGKKIMFLSQLGIKRPSMSEMSMSSSEEEKENYEAGYLDFTKEGQETFLSKLKEYYTSVQQLFFKKEGKSIPYNKGLAVNLTQTISKLASPYNGLIKVQIKTLDSKIKSQARKLSDFDERLNKQEQDLRKEFGNVYKAQRKAKAMQNQFKGFSGSNN